MEKMRDDHRDLYGKVLQMLEQQQMHQRPINAGDSLSIRSDHERRKVKEFLARYRMMPEDERRAAPALLNGLGKLQAATGDYQNAQEAFTRVAEISPDAKSCAEGHYNAYHVALERAAVENGSYQVALAELKMALRFDPERFAPFPLEDYEPQRILGAGGFGVTFLCKKKLTGSDVAVKALQADGLERDVTSVLQEASTLDQLAHPAIIRLRHCGYADPHARTRPFIEMDYFESTTLEEYVRQHGMLSVGNVLALFKTVAEALNAAHGKGILHRDVKPANLLVRRPEGRWEVRVIDFGLALKQSLLGSGTGSSSSNRSMTGADVAGTRHYAAPEQMGELSGARVGTWSDVYGWAKSCCYALFQNTEPTYLDYKKVPESLGLLLGQCLSRLPTDRPAGFAEVLDKLVKIRPDTAKPAPRPTPKPPPRKPEVEAIEIIPIAELNEGKKEYPPAIPVYPEAIPTGRPSARYPKAPLRPPPPLPLAPLRKPPVAIDPGQAVKAPGIAVAAIGMASILLNAMCLIAVMVSGDGPIGKSAEYVTVDVVLFLVFLAASILSTVGGFLMLNRKMFPLSLIGCFLSMLPIGVCCIGGLPIGIWGAMVLLRPEVRNTFT